jgi:hypothetical protein
MHWAVDLSIDAFLCNVNTAKNTQLAELPIPFIPHFCWIRDTEITIKRNCILGCRVIV